MKILLVSPVPPPAGGIATWTQIYMNSPIMKSEDITLVNIAKINTTGRYQAKYNIKHEIIRTVNILRELNKKAKSKKYNIAHINSSCSKLGLLRDYICACIIKFWRLNYVIQYHCDIEYMAKDNMSIKLIKKISKMAKCTLLLNQSSFLFLDKLGEYEKIIVPNFISNDILYLTKNEKKINEDVKKIIFVGNLTFLKGIDVIWKLAERLPEIEFICVGAKSEIVDNLPKHSNIKITGMIKREIVIQYMIEADILLFPTRSEGFPNVILEAMSVGLPIITTAVGAIPEIVEDEKGALLVKIGDIEEFYQAILKLDKSYILRKDMSIWNQKKVRKAYTENIVLEKLLKIYKKNIV